MRFTSSRAIPSRLSASVSVTSRATVTDPSLATSHPGISSLRISTSDISTITGFPAIASSVEPFFSSSIICCWDISEIACATAFINLPCFGPSFLKSAFIRFTNTPSSLLTNFISLTLTSDNINGATASISSRCSVVLTGIIRVCSGWRTLILTLRRSDRTIEVIIWARFILRSRALSITLSSAVGNIEM